MEKKTGSTLFLFVFGTPKMGIFGGFNLYLMVKFSEVMVPILRILEVMIIIKKITDDYHYIDSLLML